jgi:hypothetical protein
LPEKPLNHTLSKILNTNTTKTKMILNYLNKTPRPRPRLSLLIGQDKNSEEDLDFKYFELRYKTDPQKLYRQVLRTIAARDTAERQTQSLVADEIT